MASTLGPAGELQIRSATIHRRFALKSALFKSIGYDPSCNVVELEFVDGSVYRYIDVTHRQYLDILNGDYSSLTESPGKLVFVLKKLNTNYLRMTP